MKINKLHFCFKFMMGLALTTTSLFAKDLFKLQDKVYKSDDLNPQDKQMMFETEFNLFKQQEALLEQAALKIYLEQEAKSKNQTLEALEKTLLAVPPITDAAAKAWYDENKQRLAGREFEPIKEEIKMHLTRQKQQEAQEKLIEKIKKEKGFALLLQEPEAPLMTINTDGQPFKGPEKAKITVIEFADYSCPHCKHAAISLKQLAEKFKDSVKFVFIDFPLNLNSPVVQVAQGAHCAKRQNKFWEYHYDAFATETMFKPSSASDIAKKLGLNEKEFNTCMSDETSKKIVLDGRKKGDDVGVSATPSIYINGRRFNGYDLQDLTNAINKLLKNS